MQGNDQPPSETPEAKSEDRFKELAERAVNQIRADQEANEAVGQPDPRRAATRKRIAYGLLAASALIWIYIGGVVAYLLMVTGQPDFPRPDEAAARQAVADIVRAQKRFQTARHVDANRDGLGDFGALEQLADPKYASLTGPLLSPQLAGGFAHGYLFRVDVTQGTADTPPGFQVTATPLDVRSGNAPILRADESGTIAALSAERPK